MKYINCLNVEQPQSNEITIVAGNTFAEFLYQWDNWVDCGDLDTCEREFLEFDKMTSNSKNYSKC